MIQHPHCPIQIAGGQLEPLDPVFPFRTGPSPGI